MSKKKSKAKAPVNPLVQEKKRRITPGVVIVVVLVLAIVAAVGVDYWRKNSSVDVSSNRVEPAVITGPGTNGQGIKVGKGSAKTNIDLFLDFRCPHCAEFEEDTAPVLDELIADGTVTVTYWPMTFVNKEASPRLANAFAAAAANGKALSYGEAMYKDFSKAWTDDQLIELGKKLGIDDAKFEAAIKDNSYKGWLESIGQVSNERKVEGTPTVFVNDKMLQSDQLTVDGIKAAVSGVN